MYLNILKKDLKRKKAMNIILLIFIILASMFVSSSVNNIVSVTTALDNYLEMANAPDYLGATMNKSVDEKLEEKLADIEAIDSLKSEEIFYLIHSNIFKDDEVLNISSNTQLLQSDKDISMNYFLDDGSILEDVKSGELFMSFYVMENTGLKIGDKITIKIDGISQDFTLAGGFKDAVLGTNMVGMARYIINAKDFEAYTSSEMVTSMYGGKLFYIHTSDEEKLLSNISEVSESFILTMDRALLKFCYVFDMIVTGIILVVSLILIAIAFVVLRFTITFTLSEEYREIGVMKAIGISNLKIRGLYLTKYMALSTVGAIIGLALSFPFGELLMSISSKTVIIDTQNNTFINVVCSVSVVTVILLFCFRCTAKVKKMTPIDAIRNGQTGERFRKKSLINLGKSRLSSTSFLALNDVVSSPKRYGIITFTFFLCLSLLLMLSTTVKTLDSDALISCFGIAESDIVINNAEEIMDYMVEGGREKLEANLDNIEKTLSRNNMPAKCIQEFSFNFTIKHGEYETKVATYQGTGSTMNLYSYTAGTAPQNYNEIAITRNVAETINADIGDSIILKTVDGDKEYIVTAFFQTMVNQGISARLHTDELVNYIQASGGMGLQVNFTDNPDHKEISRRIAKIKELYPKYEEIITGDEWVKQNVAVTDTLDSVKSLIAILTVILAALITVLMERSFIAKEKGEIALMKAVGTRNCRIYAYHTTRFVIVGIVAIIVAEIFAMPLTHLLVDPIFKMMGMELAVEYVVNPIEMYILFPFIILITTVTSAFITSIYTRKIKASDTANIE